MMGALDGKLKGRLTELAKTDQEQASPTQKVLQSKKKYKMMTKLTNPFSKNQRISILVLKHY